jgi:23S rRNA (uracil1939-C5)-methyltransferase
VSVRILRLAAGGDGVGKLEDGRTVFVPRTAPGDLVTLRRLRPAKRFVRAWVDRVVEPSPVRVEPRCPHYVADECGGCQLQHIAYDAQLAARQSFVGDALRRLAHLDVPDPPIEPAERPYGYRAKLTLHAAEGGRRIGLHRYSRPDQVFDLEWCHITESALMELWQAVRPHRRLLPRNLDQLVLRLDREGGRHLVAKVHGTQVWTAAPELARALASAGQAAALWWHPEGGVPRVVAGGTGRAPDVGVFEQVNPEMGDRVRGLAVERLGRVVGARVWDLYAGIGETTAQLAAAGAIVESVELDARAVAHAEATGPAARRHAGRAEDLVGRLESPDAVVTNPPRTGMDAHVVAELARRTPGRIAYVSCDPATLARDLVRLGPGYRLIEVRAFDLFPQTAHVETVAVLERA